MNSFGRMLSLFICLTIASCQVKDSASSGGLFSGHLPTTNKFTLQTPTAKTYIEGETITLNISFPFDIIVDTTSGTPRVRMTVGATTRYATYVAQANAQILQFTYTIVAGDEDANGIDVAALELNGSTLKFDNKGVLTDCDVTTITATNLAAQKVDTTSATITDFDLVSLPGLYHVGDDLIFTMTFSEAVYVTGTPSFQVDFGAVGSPVDVTYVSGSGTTTLTFSYTVTSSDSDTNGYASITSPLDLGTGTLTDAVGNNASLDFSAHTAAVITASALVDVVGDYPFVVDVTVPAAGTYISGQNLDFVFEFDRPLNVITTSGTPYLAVTIGSNVRNAYYVSGTGTNLITFRYTAVPGDVDSDGITVATSLTANSGNIRDPAAPTTSYFVVAANNVFSVPNTAAILVSAIQPQATSVTRDTDTTGQWGLTVIDNKWNIGQQLNITVGFNTQVVVDQTLGVPSIPLTIGASTVQATYLSGTGQTALIFRYTIQEGDLDTDGSIGIGDINLNGGYITDVPGTNILLTMPTAAITTTQVDGVRPTILTVTPPADNTYSNVTGNNHLTMLFTVNWSEPVDYSTTAAYLTSDIGGTSTPLQYASGDQTAALVHRATSLATLNDLDGIAISSPLYGTSIIRDQAGNTATDLTFTPPTTTGILVDTTAPTVVSVVPAIANDTYVALENLDFTVTFSESVTVLRDGTYPRIPITIGSTTRYLEPTADTTSVTHTFRYTVVTGDEDTDGVTVGTALTNNGTTAYARDAGQNLVTGTFTPDATPLIRVDAVAPTIDSATPTAAKAYVSGETIEISVTFSESVTIVGAPSIDVGFDAGAGELTTVAGSGTTHNFSLTLDSTYFDMTGLTGMSAISLNGGTIQDANGNNAVLTYSIDMSSYFVTYPEVTIWVKSGFVNLAPPAGATAITSGDGTLLLNGAMNTITTVFMAFDTPAAADDGTNPYNHSFFEGDIQLQGVVANSNFDMITVNASVNGIGPATTHDTNFAESGNEVIQVDYTASQNYAAGAMIPATFDGVIREVIVIQGTLGAPERTNIKNYLNTLYP